MSEQFYLSLMKRRAKMELFSSSNLYNLLKPESNPELITSYEVVIGGTALPANMEKGVIIIHPLSSRPVSSQFKDFSTILEPKTEDEPYEIPEMSALQLDYQCDIYKINDLNVLEIQAEIEAHKIREWLSGMQCTEYLAGLKAQMLPIYTPLRFSSELLPTQQFANRVSFDFSILSMKIIKEWVNVIDEVVKKTLILKGGQNG